MARFRLRYQSTDLEMPVGEFVIGRSSSCALALDDVLVSRRHAILRVDEQGVMLEDLGSLNGVSLNGSRVEGSRQLEHMDRLRIGSQELVFLSGEEPEGQRPTSEMLRCDVCYAVNEPTATHCSQCSSPLQFSRKRASATLEMKALPHADPEEDTTKAAGFQLIASIAEKALVMKRFEEAERILARPLEALLKAPGEPVSSRRAELVAEGTQFALRLVEGLNSARWIDWIFRANEMTGALLDATTIDTLYRLVRSAKHTDAKSLRSYLEKVRKSRVTFSASDRFLLKRLEGLERIITA